MTDLHHVKIHGRIRPRLEVNGIEMHASKATIDFDPACLPSLIVELPVTETDIDVQALVHISNPTAQALKSLGWTPPGEGDTT